MPRTDVPVQSPASGGNSQLTKTTADATNNHSVVNDGQVTIYIENGNAGDMAVTVQAVACAHGRTVNDAATIPTGETYKFGPYPIEEWNQTDGTLQVDIDVGVSSFLWAIRH